MFYNSDGNGNDHDDNVTDGHIPLHFLNFHIKKQKYNKELPKEN